MDSHVDTHLFFSSSPASPLERQQKQVNRGTRQSHARYVDGKESKRGRRVITAETDMETGFQGAVAQESESKATRGSPSPTGTSCICDCQKGGEFSP